MKNKKYIVIFLIFVTSCLSFLFAQENNLNPEKTWAEITSLQNPIPYPKPDITLGNNPSKEDIKKYQEAFYKIMPQYIAQSKTRSFRLLELSWQYHQKYSTATHSMDNLKILAIQAGRWAGSQDSTGTLARQISDKLLEDKSLPEDIAYSLYEGKMRLIQNEQNLGVDPQRLVTRMEVIYREFMKRYPHGNKDSEILFGIASYAEQYDPSQAICIYREITQMPDPEAKMRAEGALQRLTIVSKPLAIQYTSLDRQEINSGNMRGKVLLLDFWATWCGPCMQELPHLLKVYQTYHNQGLEILGISFDEDKKSLEKTISQYTIGWSQYFDGKGWENKFGKQYGIQSIPTQWLIDKEGRVADINGRENLELKIDKLLKGESITPTKPLFYKYPFEDIQSAKKAYAEFQKIYQLSPNENMKYINQKKYPKPRMAYYFKTNSGQAREISYGPDSLFFQWSQDSLMNGGMSFGKRTVPGILRIMAGIYPYEIEGDTTLLTKRLEGDFIVRKDLTKEQFVKEFERICKEDLKMPVKMTFRDAQRKVLVAHGDFKLNLRADQPYQNIDIYGDKLEDPSRGGGGSGDFQLFLEWVGMYLHRWVISDISNPPKDELSWHYNYEEEKGSQNQNLVLQHLTEQTGLTFTEETRLVKILFVEKGK